MREFFVLVVGLLAASPLHAQAGAPYEQGVAAHRAGDPVRAVTLLEQAVHSDPGSADARVQLGYALLAMGRNGDAGQAFAEALRLTPDYDDARVGQALVAERRGDLRQAQLLLTQVDPNHAEAQALRRRLAIAHGEARWSVDADASATHLDHGQTDWREVDVQVRHRLDGGATVAGRIEAARRFDRTDVYGEARSDWSLGAGNSLHVLGGATPNADFRPKWQVGAGGRVRVIGGATPTVLTLDVRHANYRSGRISVFNPGVEQYVAGGKAWGTLQSINLVEDGNVRSGWLARGDMMASDQLRLFAGAANAPDADQGVVSRTRSLFVGASLGLNATTDLRISASLDRPSVGANRTGVSLGTTVHF